MWLILGSKNQGAGVHTDRENQGRRAPALALLDLPCSSPGLRKTYGREAPESWSSNWARSWKFLASSFVWCSRYFFDWGIWSLPIKFTDWPPWHHSYHQKVKFLRSILQSECQSSKYQPHMNVHGPESPQELCSPKFRNSCRCETTQSGHILRSQSQSVLCGLRGQASRSQVLNLGRRSVTSG